MRLPCACLCVLLASARLAFAQAQPVLVHDFNGSPGSPTALTMVGPASITRAGDRIVFIASSEAEGAELWVSDGTQQGTELVADVGPGRVSGLGIGHPPFQQLQPLIPFGQRVAFASGPALWVSDGTLAGTHLVFEGTPTSLMEQGGYLYFLTPHTTDYRYEILYRSDGTREGTQPVRTVLRPPFGGTSQILRLGSGIAVLTEDSWLRSDGTTAGTQVICPKNSALEVAATGNALYYTATTANGTTSLRRVDAATGANLHLLDSVADLGQSSIGQLFTVGEQLYFEAGNWLWSSDGTVPGTLRVAGLPSDRAIAADGRIAVSSSSADMGGVWVTDGTAAGFRRVDPGTATDLSFHGAELFFARGSQLWRSDGTEDSAALVVDLAPLGRGVIGNLGSGPDGLYFSLGNRELWKSDGTPGGTALVAIGSQVFYGNPGSLRAFGDALVFRGPPGDLYAARPEEALTSLGNRNLMGELNGRLVLEEQVLFGGRRFSLSDGTPGGTVAYVEIPRSSSGIAVPIPLGELSGRIVFQHRDPIGEGLWITDGSAAGTGKIKSPLTLGLGAFHRVADGLIYFSGDDGSGFGAELMATDGTTAGTRLVVDLAAGPANGFEGSPSFATLGRVGFFARNTAEYGREVWRTDGTPEGTQLVADVWPGITGSLPGGFATAGSRLFFSASAAAPGYPIGLNALFSTAPTGPTATLLRGGFDLSSSTGGSVAIGDRLFLTDGSELFISDGTQQGTLLTREISEGTGMSRPAGLVSIRGRAVFQACEPVNGCELWMSDGTASGTRRLTDLAPGPRSSGPEQITLAGQDLYFTATTPETGRELFRLPVGECPDGRLGPLEECDDGNNSALDGCNSTCNEENVLKLFGTPRGGALTLVVEGLSFVIPTYSGERIEELHARVADALRSSSALRTRRIRTTAMGSYLLTTAHVESVEIQDPGLIYGAPPVPVFPTPWAWVVLAVVIASTALFLRRTAG